MCSAFWVLMRRSPLSWGSPLLAVCGLYLALSYLKVGIDLADRTSEAIRNSNQLMAPLAAALSGLLGVREKRQHTAYTRITAARSSSTVPLLELASLLVPGLAVYLLIVAVLVTKFLVGHNRYGTVQVAGILEGAAELTVSIIVGYIVGRLVAVVVTPPVVLIVMYVAYVWNMDQAREPWFLFVPMSTLWVTAFDTWRANVLLWQLLWFSCLAGLLTSAMSWSFDRSRRSLTVVVLLSASLLGVATQVFAYGGQLIERADVRFTLKCFAQRPEVCVHPAYASGVPKLATAFSPVLDRLQGAILVPKLEQRPRGVYGNATLAGAAVFHLDDLRPGFQDYAVVEFVDDLRDWDACSTTDSVTGRLLMEPVNEWLVTGHVGTRWTADAYYTRAGLASAVDSFNARSEPQKMRWLKEHWEQYRTCRLTPVDFLGN